LFLASAISTIASVIAWAFADTSYPEKADAKANLRLVLRYTLTFTIAIAVVGSFIPSSDKLAKLWLYSEIGQVSHKDVDLLMDRVERIVKEATKKD
jgi:amino acid permease